VTSGKEGQGRPHRACWLQDLRVFRETTHSKGRQLCLNSVGVRCWRVEAHVWHLTCWLHGGGKYHFYYSMIQFGVRDVIYHAHVVAQLKLSEGTEAAQALCSLTCLVQLWAVL